jgi:hypothetical protein
VKRRILLLPLAAVVAAASIILLLSTPAPTLHDQGAIGFGSSVNATTITQSQTVRVYLEDWNKLDSKNSLPTGDGLKALNLSSGQCGGLYPGGIAVYEGQYSLSNFSSASPLSFFPPGVVDCGAIEAQVSSNSFAFEPMQNVTAHLDLVGYWTSGNTPQVNGGYSPGVLHPFLPGAYTVITGDAWGNAKVLYFHVVGATGNFERTGPTSSFPASWLNPCDQSAIGNVTTMTELGLNSSSDFDHININAFYAQVLNSSGFAYHSVGHGWVVAEWYEIQGSGSNTGDPDQAIAYFILTSDGVPSGYLYAHYDLVSDTVSVTFASIQPASCAA